MGVILKINPQFSRKPPFPNMLVFISQKLGLKCANYHVTVNILTQEQWNRFRGQAMQCLKRRVCFEANFFLTMLSLICLTDYKLFAKSFNLFTK